MQLSIPFSPLKSLDPALVSQLRDTHSLSLPDPLFERLNGSLSIGQERLKFADYKIRVLEERLRLVRIEKYGPGSEKLSDAQLELLEVEPGVSSAEVGAESERGQLSLPLRTARSLRAAPPCGRDTSNLFGSGRSKCLMPNPPSSFFGELVVGANYLSPSATARHDHSAPHKAPAKRCSLATQD
jgi:hypothetical protein